MQKKFQTLIKKFADLRTIARAKHIKKTSINVIEINKSDFIIKASIQDDKVVPYKLNLDLTYDNFSESVEHDCKVYLERIKRRQQFCKHLVRLFFYLFEQDNNFACGCLEKLLDVRSKELQWQGDQDEDINHFISSTIEKSLNFKCLGFEEFFDILDLEQIVREKLKLILLEAKQYPGALEGHHGNYRGGLFDHILLVTNYAYHLQKTLHNKADLYKVILTAIYHDFGKISYYGFLNNNSECQVPVSKMAIRNINTVLRKKYHYSGKDPHIEGAIAVVRKFNLPIDREIERGIIFHHGSWSRYTPNDMNRIGTIVHVADMMAAQVLYI
ncbi:MAG: HD domain-containing protein [Promethearchaeia archaeon]